MTEYIGLDVEKIISIREDIINISREKKLNPDFYKKLIPEMQKDIKKLIGNYNQLIKLSLDLINETKDYSKTTYSFNEDDLDEYNALMAIIGE